MTGSLPRFAFWTLITLIAAFLVMPALVMIPISFTEAASLQFPPVGFTLRWYSDVLQSELWQAATFNSLKVAGLTVVFSVMVGTAAALSLFSLESRFKPVIQGFILSPLVTPVVVLAIGIFIIFSRWGLAGTLIGVVLAHTVLAIPFVVVSVLASLHMVNPNLTIASNGLGASSWRTFRRITLPLIAPGIIAGAVFAFITSWDEVVAAIFLTDAYFTTVPVVVWSQVRTELSPAIAAVGTILITISALALFAVHLLQRSGKR